MYVKSLSPLLQKEKQKVPNRPIFTASPMNGLETLNSEDVEIGLVETTKFGVISSFQFSGLSDVYGVVVCPEYDEYLREGNPRTHNLTGVYLWKSCLLREATHSVYHSNSSIL